VVVFFFAYYNVLFLNVLECDSVARRDPLCCVIQMSFLYTINVSVSALHNKKVHLICIKHFYL
jgi:hypothetical protein